MLSVSCSNRTCLKRLARLLPIWLLHPPHPQRTRIISLRIAGSPISPSRYNKIVRVGDVFQIANARSDAGGASSGGGFYSLHDLPVEDVHEDDLGGLGLFAMIFEVPPADDVRIEHATAFVRVAVFSFMNPGEKRAKFHRFEQYLFSRHTASGQRRRRRRGAGNCAYEPDLQGLAGVLKSCFTDSCFTHNLITSGSGWPSGNFQSKDLPAAGIREIRGAGTPLQALPREGCQPGLQRSFSSAEGSNRPQRPRC